MQINLPCHIHKIALIVVTLILSTSIENNVLGQEYSDPTEMFEEGQFFFLREDYKEALFFYKKLTGIEPHNANFNFKVGECYLNIPGQEYLAVSYFEEAIKKTVPKKEYDVRDFKEDDAPLHAFFYLGNAYRAAGKLDDALIAYQEFINSPFFYNNYNLNVVETEIKSCERAKIIQDSPIKMEKNALSEVINTNYSEFNAVKSKDGNSLVFIRGLKFYDAVFYAKKTDGGWSTPKNINPEIVSDGDFYPTALNANGTKLLLVREKDLNSDIYISYLRDNEWTKAIKLEGRINTAAQETHASFGIDDNTIYFVSDRQGSKGGKDIFVSKLVEAKNTWGKPKNIGNVINTELDEATPVICDNGKTLFFSSKGHYNMGGYDIFFSYLEGDKWSVPRNIGYPLNTTRDDLFYMVDDGCKTGYFSIIDPESGYSDIYEVIVEQPLALPEHEQ